MKNQTHEPDCACCRLGPEGAKKLEQDLRERYGHIVIGVHDHPPFAYSVGLWNNNLPELIIMGMDGRQSTMSINLVAAWMEAERIIPEHGSIHDSPFRLPTKFLRVAEREMETHGQDQACRARAIAAPLRLADRLAGSRRALPRRP